MDKKTNFIDIIIYVVIAVILLTVLPILANMSIDGTSSEPISSEPISSEPIPSYPTNVVVFKSDSPRTITPKYTNSGITLQYSIDKGLTWNNILSDETTVDSDEIWFRGSATGAKSLYTSASSSNAWSFSSDSSNKLHVYGDLRFLLCDNLGDNNITFNIDDYCYAHMFRGCSALTTAPSLPADKLADYCYNALFSNCTSLITVPNLPAKELVSDCYTNMFNGCSALKVSTTQTESYQYAWRIPTSGIGTTEPNWALQMFLNTGGPFTDNPTINTTYYVENPPV